jgi:hypothetical protein
MDRKWAAIFLFYIASAVSWTQDLLALIPCRTTYSSQCDQKIDLIEETRQYIYTSTLPLTCGFLRPKCGPCRTACSSQYDKKTIWWKILGNKFIPLMCGFLKSKHGPKMGWNVLFYIAPARSWTQDFLTLILYRTVWSSQCNQKTDLIEELGNTFIFQHRLHVVDRDGHATTVV